jgi:hypothetical protein
MGKNLARGVVLANMPSNLQDFKYVLADEIQVRE